MDIWHTASLADGVSEGWLGKSLKSIRQGAFHVASKNETTPLAMMGAPARVPTLTSLSDFQLKVPEGPLAQLQKQIIHQEVKPPANSNITVANDSNSQKSNPASLLDFVRKTSWNTYLSSDRLQELGKSYTPKVSYPGLNVNPLADRLKICAQLIEAGLGARILFVSIDNFDTHANQGGANGTHANLLRQLSEAISAFYLDMEARGHGKRLLIMTFSEFGRRAAENGSKGTDHGSAAPMFLVGGKIKNEIIGKHPSLTETPLGNLQHHTDFRQIYATILDRWLGVSSKEVLGESFAPVACL